MIDLSKMPYYLNDDGVRWVENTLSEMSTEEKVGQLFCVAGTSADDNYMDQLIHKYRVGGIMFRADHYETIYEAHNNVQTGSKIPMLIAANLESGGVGQVTEGTLFGTQMQVAATNRLENAYHLGAICAKEANAVGGNWAFAPVMDININFRNPITNTRTYGSNTDLILSMGKEYLKGTTEGNMAVSIKHFPGDGMDDRDQHLMSTVNNCTVEEWDNTYGIVFQGMIDAGAQTVMVGHIMLPAYQKLLNTDLADEEILPATLSPELMTGLLRNKLGFRGLTITDASTMAGFTQHMTRAKAVPACIMAGADMLLFSLGVDDDYNFMLDGVKNGILTMQRLDEAVTRILGIKASLGLHEKQMNGTLMPPEETKAVLNCKEHQIWAKKCADEAITLVKNSENMIPLCSDTHKKILLIVLGEGEKAGSHSGGGNYSNYFMEKLKTEGFIVTRFMTSEIAFSSDMLFQQGEHFIDNHDMVLYYANESTFSNSNEIRINWSEKLQIDSVRYLQDKPHVFISVAYPYHLQDVPRVKTFINCYTPSKDIVDALVEKLMGRSEFKGISPADPFCGYWDTHL